MNTANIKSCVAALAAAVALSASADLLYWTVSDAKFDANSGKAGAQAQFAYATISADGGETYLRAYDQNGQTDYWKLYATGYASTMELNDSTGAAYYGAFDSDDVTSLKVELWNASNEKVGWQTYGMSSLMESIWKGDTPGGSGATAFHATSFVPEPTSGLLLALGGALLALRRRRAA